MSKVPPELFGESKPHQPGATTPTNPAAHKQVRDPVGKNADDAAKLRAKERKRRGSALGLDRS
jgi:hypothetical protein